MRLASLAPLAFLVFVVGCGDRPGGGEQITREALPNEIATVACNAFASCELPVPLPFGGDSCAPYFEALYRNQTFAPYEAAIERGTIVYNGAAARECVDTYAAIGCDFAQIFSTSDYFEACSRIWDGQVADGDACGIDEECAETSYCALATECPGTCTPRTAAGEACTTFTECVLGYFCSEGTCQRFLVGSEDGMCATGAIFDCRFDEACIGATADTPGVCTPLSELRTRAAGESCSTTPSAGQLCQEGLSCALVDSVALTYECVAPVGSGEPCFLAAAPSMCPAGEYCRTTDTGSACAAFAAEGDSCASTTCAFPLRCNTATNLCASLAENGDACTDNNLCFSNQCVDNMCQAPMTCVVP